MSQTPKDFYERMKNAAPGSVVPVSEEELRAIQPLDRVTILDKAKAAVYGDRERDYGPVTADMKCIAAMWTAILGMHVEPHHVPLCMVALKIARLTYSINHNDSLVDVAGWAAVLERLLKEQSDAVQDKR